NRHPVVTYAYHFLSEALIIFLIAIPIMHYNYEFVPYWAYFLTVIGFCLLFSLFTQRTTSYGVYIISAPLIIITFYLLQFPLELSVIFGVALTWRYINIRKETMLSRESSYIRWALVLSTLDVILINDRELIV